MTQIAFFLMLKEQQTSICSYFFMYFCYAEYTYVYNLMHARVFPLKATQNFSLSLFR